MMNWKGQGMAPILLPGCQGEWFIHTWRSKKSVPNVVKEDKEATVVEVGRWKVGILKGSLTAFGIHGQVMESKGDAQMPALKSTHIMEEAC